MSLVVPRNTYFQMEMLSSDTLANSTFLLERSDNVEVMNMVAYLMGYITNL